jgi:hypothetical protein
MSILDSAESNQRQIQQWIQKKTNPPSGSPDSVFITPAAYLTQIATDMNEFPYPRYFRGRALSDIPYIFDREAGFQNILQIRDPPPVSLSANLATTDLYCFQPACGTIFPCQANPNNRMNSRDVTISP